MSSSPQILHLRLFGSPQVEIAGKRVTFATRKVMALLAYLAVTNQPHQRDALAALLWPEVDQARARGSLRHALADLRKAFGEEWLDLDGETLSLAAGDSLSVDVTHFRHWVQQVQTHRHPHNQLCARCLELLTEAATLYGGDFLAGFSLDDSPTFDEWQYFQSERLRHEYAGVLERLADFHGVQGAWDAAIGYAQRWLELDPLHEAAHRHLMHLYAQSGQQAAALRQYERCLHILETELGVAPAPETTDLYAQIRQGRVNPPTATLAELIAHAPQHNLPVETTPFIGRSRELADLASLLQEPTVRLVTILGLGGMGKTRLALAAAARHLEQSQEPVYFVALGGLLTVDHLVTAIADQVGFIFHPSGRPLEEELIDYLRAKAMLLVLDNFEHLLAGCEFIHLMLQAAPGVHILATSRERLQLSEEVVFALGGMSVQKWESLDDALSNESVQLFVQSARRVQHRFALATPDIPAVAEICPQVGGMPLGIMLAAAWLDLLNPAEIVVEITHGRSVLQTELRDVPERQRSIRALFEHTWRKLDETERNVLMKLSFFRSGFTREAATAVAGASLQTLSTLLNKSLVQRVGDGRYQIHELLRQYGENELVVAGAVEATGDAHSAYFAAFLAQREHDLKGPWQKAVLGQIEADFDNIRQAWQWLCDHRQTAQLAQAMECLGMYYEWFGHAHEGIRSFGQVADQFANSNNAAGQRLRANALIWQTRFLFDLGEAGRARDVLQQCLNLLGSSAFSAQDFRLEWAAVHREAGRLAYDAGKRQEASALFVQSLELYQELENRWQQAKLLLDVERVGRNLHGLGSAGEHQQQAEKSRSIALESLAIFREVGDQAKVAAGLTALGLALLALGLPAEAQVRLEEALALCHELSLQSNTFVDVTICLGFAEECLGLYTQMDERGRVLLAFGYETRFWKAVYYGDYLAGCAALAQQEYDKAESLLAQNVALLRTNAHGDALAFALVTWGLATYWTGNEAAAQARLIESLQTALEVRAIEPIVRGLMLAALLFARRGEKMWAVELYSVSYRYAFVANSRWCHDVAGRQLAEIAATLPPSVLASTQQRGNRHDVWQTAQNVLAWLRGAEQ